HPARGGGSSVIGSASAIVRGNLYGAKPSVTVGTLIRNSYHILNVAGLIGSPSLMFPAVALVEMGTRMCTAHCWFGEVMSQMRPVPCVAGLAVPLSHVGTGPE